jgi:hypothetical protein
MRLPRMTTRRWMGAVAVFGVLIGGYRLKLRHDYFASRAQYHELRERYFRNIERSVTDSPVNAKFFVSCQDFPSSALRVKGEKHGITHLHLTGDEMGLPEKIAYHAAITRKYQHAARYPWLTVEPDPPMPW